jgi:putative PIN family toxin of toxin-antitoxin system
LPPLDCPRLVLDTNIVLRGVANADSAAGRVLRMCDLRVVMIILSKSVLAEYRAVLRNPDVVGHHSAITPQSVELLLRRLRYVSDWHAPVPARFRFARDPGDEPFIELAIAGRATHLITFDNDLLSLPRGFSDAARRFRQRLPSAKIIDPAEFLKRLIPRDRSLPPA